MHSNEMVLIHAYTQSFFLLENVNIYDSNLYVTDIKLLLFPYQLVS